MMRCLVRYSAVALLAAGIGFLFAHLHLAPDASIAPVVKAQPPEPLTEQRAVQAVAVPHAAPASTDEDVSPEELVNMRVYDAVNRSVVNVMTRSIEVDDFFLTSRSREGSGSGSVLDKAGHILTNYHVIDGARQVAVTLFDGHTYEARVVGTDPNNDVAVLRIKAPPDALYPITFGDSSKLHVGMKVLAIGNPFGLERTLTTGIVSSLNRSLRSENDRLIRGIIQTDAAINPGNSGGPLMNRHGEMVGITTAIVSRAGQSSGIGLAIPVNTARRIVAELIRYGHVIRPDCGIFSVYETDRGLLIGRLVPHGAAARAGLRGPQLSVVRRGDYEFRRLDRSRADLIVAVDGRKVKTLDDLLSYVESKKVGHTVTFSIIRDGEQQDVMVKLEQSQD